MKKLACLIAASLLSSSALAEKVAIVGGKVFTMAEQGTLEEGTVLMTDGKVDRVIKGASAPEGYTVVDAKGKVVTPGLVGSMTSLGLVEVSSSAVASVSGGPSLGQPPHIGVDVEDNNAKSSTTFQRSSLHGYRKPSKIYWSGEGFHCEF